MNRTGHAFFLLLILAVPADAEQHCALIRQASLDMEMDETGRVTVPVTFNGIAKRLLVDTGTPVSMITAPVAKDLGLSPRPAPGDLYYEGMGGIVRSQMVDVGEFGIGEVKARDVAFVVETRTMDAAGLLGADFMNRFDVEFDFAQAKLNLISPEHCPGQVSKWTTQPYRLIPFEYDGGHIKVKVRLDGADVWAILDTGAPDTIMSLERTAHLFAVDQHELTKRQSYPFQTLFFGGVNVLHPAITLLPDDQSALLADQNMSMIIGMTVLRRLHLYISYREKMIYATPASVY